MSKKSNSGNDSYKKLFSNTLVFAIGSFSSKILVLLLIPIYTSYLTTSELGVTDVLTQIANWMIPIVTMTITEAIIRFGLDKAYDKVKVFTIGNIICAFGLAVFGIILPIVNLTGLADKYIGNYCIILYTYVFMSSVKSLYTTFVRAMEHVKTFAIAGIIGTFFTLFFTALFYIFLPGNYFGVNSGIIKYLLATILADLLTTIFVTLKVKLWKYLDFRHIDREMMHTMLQYSVPLIPAQLLWLITNSSDSFMTTHYLGSDYNGILSAAYKIPNIVATVYMMFGQAWNMSAITEHDSKGRNKFYENVFDFNQSLLYILAAGCLLIIQPLTRIMIGSNFQECINYSPILIYSTIFSCFTTFMGSIYLATKKTKRSLFTSLVSGVINVGLNVILIPTIGLYGPPISTVASYLTVFIIRAYDSRKLIPFRMNLKKLIVNNVIILGMLAITLVYTNLFEKPVWYVVMFILFLVVFGMNIRSINSIFYKLLPARIADKVSKIHPAGLVLAILTFVSFIIINVFTSFVPMFVLLALGFIVGLAKRNLKLCIPCEIFFTIIAAVEPGSYITGLAVTLFTILLLIKFPGIKKSVLNLIIFDICAGFIFGTLWGVFFALVEIPVLVIIYRKQIWEKINDIAYKRH